MEGTLLNEQYIIVRTHLKNEYREYPNKQFQQGQKEGRKNIRRTEKQNFWENTDTLESFDCWTSHIKLEMVKEKSNLLLS